MNSRLVHHHVTVIFVILALHSEADLPSLFIMPYWLPLESYDFQRLQASLDYPAMVSNKYATGTPSVLLDLPQQH